MANYKSTILFIILSLCLSSCSSLSDNDHHSIGNPITGGSVGYSKIQISPNKYIINAFATADATETELSQDFKLYVNKLCQPKTPVYNYKIKSTSYMGTSFRPGSQMKTEGLDLIGHVTCQ